MSHEHTVIEPAPGLTVIAGPNNIGKSAVVVALQLLCFNDRSTYVLRHGERRCHVVVETDGGHRIEWTRGKNGGASYRIDGQLHDRLQGSVPDDVHKILKMPQVTTQTTEKKFDLHFGEQKSPVFLLNESEQTIAQFFAASSDAGHLIAMQNRHKENIKSSRREQNQLKAEKDRVQGLLDLLDPVTAIAKQSAKCEQQYQQISKRESEIEGLDTGIREIESTTRDVRRQRELDSVLDKLTPAPDIEETTGLEQSVSKISSTENELRFNSQLSKFLNRLKTLPQIAESRLLEQVCANITVQIRMIDRSNARLKSLTNLQQPPLLTDSAPLASLITNMKSAEADRCLRKQQTKPLGQLVPPPEPLDIAALQTAIRNLQTEAAKAKELNQSLADIDQTIKEVRTQIDAWAKANPVCPACGNAVHSNDVLCGLDLRGLDLRGLDQRGLDQRRGSEGAE